MPTAMAGCRLECRFGCVLVAVSGSAHSRLAPHPCVSAPLRHFVFAILARLSGSHRRSSTGRLLDPFLAIGYPVTSDRIRHAFASRALGAIGDPAWLAIRPETLA